MKNIMRVGAFAVAMFTAVSCSENETDIPQPDNNGQVALGVTTNLKVDAGTKSVTRSVVVGNKITYNKDNYANNDSVPGIGIAILNKAKNAWYSPDGSNHTAYATSHQVWFVGDEAGANWLSILTKGATHADQEETPFYLTKDVGCVYAYYPYSANALSSVIPSSEADLKVPANLLATGTIDAQYANNAAMKWDGAKWASNGSTSSAARKQKIASLDEKDYMYHDATVAGGRYVNNGHADGFAVVKPDADADNANENNPGWKIGLSMNHALSMVSFRVYDGGKLSTSDVTLKSIVIKNHSGVANFLGEGTMSLVDGTITTSGSAATITRNISNYILKRQIETGDTESENQFIVAGTGLNAVSGKTVSKAVSMSVYPISFSDNEIDVTVTLNDSSDDMVFTVTLPAMEWVAGSNYIYTLMAGKNKLDVVSVDVTDWVDEEISEEIPL
ncbi:fimbrillin family protein [Parabacteroides chinchillae]|uniref:Fimbrillin-like n=1 Tax=Parabacteroides chinchillae TaxID=871327 RepID=A0A8G2F340_9BACT|nr:fimbrillin family protein [Parabacteroides chinchillae]SEF43686.1 Fimbrillin-like [Parabacteroides chinchillae]